MKILEVTSSPLILMPTYATTNDGKIKTNTSSFETTSPLGCSDCNGTGRTRKKGVHCSTCGGKGSINGTEPKYGVPLFLTTTKEFEYLKQLLKFKVNNTKGVIFQNQIPTIRRNIMLFNNKKASALPATKQTTGPKVEIDKKTGLHTIIPHSKQKENISRRVKQFEEFISSVQKINGASILIKEI